ncbi:BMP family lipoprotein [Lachnoclostridium sp.]|uniref:BMP family lipoprotein n=1 Tax=Lachnoclostridium sp. TaxID=2028282 RepID=UPI003FA54D57
MMKKIISLMLIFTMAITVLSGCGKKDTGEPNGTGTTPGVTNGPTNENNNNNNANNNKPEGYELALVTDVGTIDDKSFNQGAWEGLSKYATEKNKTHKYYQPAEATTAAYIDTIALAVKGGAKLIVCPGYKFSEAVFEAQTTYPDVKFIILDSQPEKAEDKTIKDNVYAVYYAEHQAGFLAGYAAVKDGYTKLGFMGGMAVPAVKHYGYGFVLGAETAAKEMGIDKIDMKYHYTGGFAATPEAKTTAASWYQSGTQVIFGCGGAVGNSVMAAAQDNNGKVIGVDVDQSNESATVITSAMKELNKSVYDAIALFYEGKFPGGKIVTLDVKAEGVGLPLKTSKFQKFTEADYGAVYAKLVSGEYAPKVEGIDEVTKLPVTIVKIDEVK